MAREIAAAGGQAVASTDSVAAYDSASRVVRAAVDAFGRIDAVINNAGNLRDRVFHKMSEDEWAQVIAVHLNGSFYMSRAAAPYFREQESGAFVHMTSTRPDRAISAVQSTRRRAFGVVRVAQASIALDMASPAVYLASDAAAAVNAQVFAVRANEIMLMSQPRPLRSVHHGEG